MKRILAAGLLAMAPQLYAQQSPPQADCSDKTPLSHTFHPKRLATIKPCVSVDGIVKSVWRSSDGDAHVNIQPDEGYGWALNWTNRIVFRGRLVVEIVCAYPPTRKAPLEACKGYTNKITLPKVGDHWRATGPLVQDTNYSHREIHPVLKGELLPAYKK